MFALLKGKSKGNEFNILRETINRVERSIENTTNEYNYSKKKYRIGSFGYGYMRSYRNSMHSN